MPQRGGIGQVDTNLAVTHLAKRATVLAGHTHRVAALFGSPALIQDEHPIEATHATQTRTKKTVHRLDHREVPPGGLSQEAL